MKKINVYQSELNMDIPLEYIGRVQYIGETFGAVSLTDGKEYDVVFDRNRTIKVVDDSGEDYIYSLVHPKPLDGSSKGGTFRIVEDPHNILCKLINV